VSHNPKLKYLDCRYHDMCDIDSVVGIENCTELAADKFFFAPQNIVDRGHSWDGGKITIEPSCMEKGETTYTCTHCGISKTEEIAAIGYHVLEPDWDMDRENHWHTCTVCDAQLDKSNHSYHNRQDTVCNVCGYQRSSNVSVGHNASSYRSFTITAAAGKGGKIMPEGKVSVRDGVNKTFTIIPDSGYEIADVLVDGKSVGAVTDYLFEKVNHEHCIEVRFQESANSGGYQMCSKDEHCPIWRYTDAGVGEWYHDGVHFCIENGLMRGDGNNQFRPADTLTRGMLVQILYNEAGRPAVSGSCSFDDVVSDRWYANAVIWAAQEGIVKGFDNHRFAPDVPITREQLAVMLYRYEQTHGGGFHGNWLFRLDFHDADTINEWAYEAICWLTMNQVILGEENRTLRPKGLVTRAEAAMMVQRYFNVLL
jgi:hypothetical protein